MMKMNSEAVVRSNATCLFVFQDGNLQDARTVDIRPNHPKGRNHVMALKYARLRGRDRNAVPQHSMVHELRSGSSSNRRWTSPAGLVDPEKRDAAHLN